MPLAQEDIAFLESMDTPTVCNVVEVVAPERRGHGYTTRHLHCAFPDLPPRVGFAKTVTMRAKDPPALAGEGYMQRRLDYLDYVASQPNPSWMVIQDLDDPAGYGAFWGEVQSNIHKALGCHGVVTNGCVRDIPMIAEGFQMLAGSIAPSHAFVHVVDFGGEVTVHGMAVKSGDLIHADRHGAIVIPIDKISAMRAALDKLAKTEARIIAATRTPGATVETIKAALRG
jgi:regulator of RNase E activity RraA